MNTTKKSIMTTKQPKNKPMRKCVGCNEMKEKESLLRIALNASGGAIFDTNHTVQSRGAYLCKSKECYKKVLKNKGLERSFKRKLSDDFYNELEQVFLSYED